MSYYRNFEGYRDPTMGAALSNISREMKRAKKLARKRVLEEKRKAALEADSKTAAENEEVANGTGETNL